MGVALTYDDELLAAWLEEQELTAFYNLSVSSDGGGVNPITFGQPNVMLRILVEVVINGTLYDITSRVKYEDKIVITRGRTNERSTAPSHNCRLTLMNPDRLFSPRNTGSAFYPYLRRAVELRVSVDPGSGMLRRFTGEIPDFGPLWTMGDDRTIPVEAFGKLQSFEDNDPPAKSALRRASLALTPVSLWMLEEGSSSTRAANAVPGGAPLIASDTPAPSWSNDTTDLPGVAAVPKFWDGATSITNNMLTGRAGGTSTTAWSMSVWVKATTADAVTTGAFRILGWGGNPTNSDNPWEVSIFAHGTGVATYSAEWDFTSYALATTGDPFDGLYHHIVVTAQQSGANIRVQLYVDGTLLVDNTSSSPSYTLLPVDDVRVAPAVSATTGGPYDVWMSTVAVFDRVLSATEIADYYLAGNGYLAEAPTDRFARVATEEGISYAIAELVVDTEPMGPQRPGTVLDILRACDGVNEGVLNETVYNELRLESRTWRYRQAPALIADYAHAVYGNQVYDLKGTDDGFALRNEWQVSRDGGSTGVMTLDDGSSLSISAPPTGVGRRDEAATLALREDAQTVQHAGWRVRKGTVDEPRFKVITIALHRNPELIPQWKVVDVGSRMIVYNPPLDIGLDDPDQIIEGMVETIDQFTLTVDYNTSPYSAGIAFLFGDIEARYDCAGSTLSGAHDSSTTTLNLSIVDNCVWAHDYGDYLITVGGEDMTVTAVGAAAGTFPSRTQALTVTRSVNGAVLAHVNGEQVRLKRPARYAL